jgi:hypothetical protein
MLEQTQPFRSHAQLPRGCPAGTHLNLQSHGNQSQVNNVVFSVLQNCSACLCCVRLMCAAAEIRIVWPGGESNM